MWAFLFGVGGAAIGVGEGCHTAHYVAFGNNGHQAGDLPLVDAIHDAVECIACLVEIERALFDEAFGFLGNARLQKFLFGYASAGDDAVAVADHHRHGADTGEGVGILGGEGGQLPDGVLLN